MSMRRSLSCGLLLCAAVASGFAAAAPYNLWAEPCLTPLDSGDAVREELRAAVANGSTGDAPVLVCKALGILDGERWQQQWVAWHQGSDEAGCGTPEQQRTWQAELFLSPNVHQIAHECARRAGDADAAAAAAAIRDAVIEVMLRRANGKTFDQGVPLLMPADLMAYAPLLDGEVLALWAKPYQRGTRMLFKVLVQARDGKPQRHHYFEWALPIWASVIAAPDSARAGPWYAQQSGAAFARDGESGPLAAAASVYAAYADFERSSKDDALLGRLRERLQAPVQRGDMAAVFEQAQYEMELPGGEPKIAIDLLLALADAGDARATAKLAVPTLLFWGGLKGGEEAAGQLLARASRQLAPGAAEFYAGTQLEWVGSRYADEWAQRWLAASAEQGLPEGMYAYARHLQDHNQQAPARIWIERAAAGHVTAIGLLVKMIGADEPAALPWIQRAAHWDPGAMRMLAKTGGDEGAALARRAALAGDPAAAVVQARRLLALDTADADQAALRWSHWGVQHGSAEALTMAIAVDFRGRTEHADPQRGVRMLELLRKNDYPINAEDAPEALFEIARREESGDLLPANRRRALKSYKALASREHPGALLRLAEIEGQGRISKARSERTASLLVRAHAAGARAAAAQLAALYADPERRIADAEQAAHWQAIAAGAQ
jgi:hypothetical protein